MRNLATVFLILFAGSACCQQPAADSSSVLREKVLAPGIEALEKGDCATAAFDFDGALSHYPDDPRVLMLTAAAARCSGKYDLAKQRLHLALVNPGAEKWSIRFELIRTDAAMQDWTDFDRERAAVRAAKKSGDPQLAGVTGYMIEEFKQGSQSVRVIEYPATAGRYHTLYRFFFPAPNPAADGFTPYIDLESDDFDQASFKQQHPDKAAAGERSYSLDSYPKPMSQGLIKFYWDGEPSYETVPTDALGALASQQKAAEKK